MKKKAKKKTKRKTRKKAPLPARDIHGYARSPESRQKMSESQRARWARPRVKAE